MFGVDEQLLGCLSDELVLSLNIIERVSITDRAVPRVCIFSNSDTQGRSDRADHMKSASYDCYAEEGDQAEHG